nr:hypothetical protein [Chitinophaga sedimenti]
MRAMLYHLAALIQQTDFCRDEQVAPVLTGIEALLQRLRKHNELEDRFVLPAIKSFHPHLSADFLQEHETAEAQQSDLSALLAAWRIARDDAARMRAGQRILYTFNELIAFTLYHQNKEESVLNKSLWAHYPDASIVQLETAMFSALSPGCLLEESRWMLRALNDAEVITG